MYPDFYLPIFQQADLPDYDPSSYMCEAAPADHSETPQFSQTSQNGTRGRLQGESFDDMDKTFYLDQRRQNFPPDAYSNEFFQCSEQNPRKWCEIGIAYNNNHAAIIIQDITGTKTDIPKSEFEFLGRPGQEDKSFDKGDIRRLHLARTHEEGGHIHYDLWFNALRVPKVFKKYYSVCRLRTTDRMIKYHAFLSFPRHYRVVASDCATFAHNFLIKTLTGLRDENHINKDKFDSIVKNLVQHNHVTDGATGETEGVSRRNEVLVESGGATVESYIGMY
jgi:hypothetical protein